MHETWARFARTGNLGWDPYGNECRATMRIDAEWTRADDPRGQERRTPTSCHRPFMHDLL